MAERLGGEGDVVVINGPPVSSVIQRVAGCETVLLKYPGIRILSDDRNSGGSRFRGNLWEKLGVQTEQYP